MTGTSLVEREVGWEYLTGKQRAFAVAWVKYHDPQKALTEAGYASVESSNPSRDAARLIKRCRRFIDHLEETALREARISIAGIQHEYAKVGFSNPLNYVVELPGGGHRAKMLTELTRAEAAAIESFTLLPLSVAGKPDIWVLGEIKFHNKIKALDSLCKTMGIGLKPQPGERPPEPARYDLSRLPAAKLAELEGILRAAANTVSDARDSSAIPGESSGAGGQQIPSLSRPAR
jgi:hypothetical protein